MNSFLLPLSTFTLVLKERSVLLLLQPKSYYLSWYCSFFSFTGIIISILMVIHSYANSIECTQWAEKLGKKCNFSPKLLHIWLLSTSYFGIGNWFIYFWPLRQNKLSFFHILAHSVLSGGRRLRLPEKSMGWLVVTLSFLKKATGNEAILHFQFCLSRRKKKKMVNFFSKSRGHALARPKIFFYGGESSKRERRWILRLLM